MITNCFVRHDEDGNPVECCLLDFQAVLVASPATDLNGLFFTCMDGNVRQRVRARALQVYHEEYERILAIYNQDMTFTYKDLQEEMEDKDIYGIAAFVNSFNDLVFERVKLPPIEDYISGVETEDILLSIEELQKRYNSTLKRENYLLSRFESMIKDIRETGKFDR